MKPLAPNTLLQNRYLVVHLIGKGGMGEVYLAVDQRLGSAIALKRTFFSDDEILNNAFEREARTLARMRHPALPKVSDHFTEHDTQYLVMEHISGDDLAKRLEITNKPFPLNWVLFWADQLLDALGYLHSHEPPIIHRDIKPQNLKLTDENHIILLDFGLAKNSLGNTRMTTTGGSLVGYTPHYASMEQIRGSGTNARSDIYSLSATIYQLLTNVVPPDALTRADKILNSSPDPLRPMDEVNTEIPKAISEVILKGMSLSSEQRYTSAREMQKALRDAYSQTQSAMAAQTLAFNTPTGAENKPLPQSQQQTEQFATPMANQVSAQNAPPPNFDSVSSTKTEDVHASAQLNAYSSQPPNLPQSEDFDATMKYDSEPLGVKTEVLPKEKLPQAENFSPSAQEENFNTSDYSPAREEKFDASATVPLINFDKQDEQTSSTSNFDSIPQTEETRPPADTFAPVENVSQTQENYAPAPVYNEPKKKSGGRGLAVAGILGVLGVLTVGAAAIGWYMLKPSQVTVSPTPTPRVEISVTPTTEPTMEADTNTSNTSTDITTSTNTSTDNTSVRTTDTTTEKTRPTVEKTVQPTPVKATPTPRVTTVKTPVTVKTPTTTTTKPPVKGGRTDILQ